MVNLEREKEFHSKDSETGKLFFTYRQRWRSIIEELKIDLGNSSSIATSELCDYLETGRSLKDRNKYQEAKYCKTKRATYMNVGEMKKEFELTKAEKKRKHKRKMMREVKRLYLDPRPKELTRSEIKETNNEK